MASFGRLAAVEVDRRQGASEVENYGKGPWQEGLYNFTLYITLVALQYKCILVSGAFNYVLYKRLLWILKKKGLLDWIIKFT